MDGLHLVLFSLWHISFFSTSFPSLLHSHAHTCTPCTYTAIWVVFFSWPHHMACGSFLPRDWAEMPPAVEAWSLNHWTTKEVCIWVVYFILFSAYLEYFIKTFTNFNFLVTSSFRGILWLLILPCKLYTYNLPSLHTRHLLHTKSTSVC